METCPAQKAAGKPLQSAARKAARTLHATGQLGSWYLLLDARVESRAHHRPELYKAVGAESAAC